MPFNNKIIIASCLHSISSNTKRKIHNFYGKAQTRLAKKYHSREHLNKHVQWRMWCPVNKTDRKRNDGWYHQKLCTSTVSKNVCYFKKGKRYEAAMSNNVLHRTSEEDHGLPLDLGCQSITSLTSFDFKEAIT